MTNRKTTLKVKEPIKFRFKNLANGNQSIYLAHWNNTINKWEYERLKDLYIVLNNKEANDRTLKLANAIKAQRIVELQNNTHGFSNNSTRSKANVIDYIKALAEKKKEKAGGSERGNYQNYLALVYHIQKYSGDKTTFKSVDKRYCEGFLDYLKTATRGNVWGDRLSQERKLCVISH